MTLAELAGEHYAARAGSGSRHAVDRHLAAVGMPLNVRLSLASNEAIRDLAASGMGLGVLSRHALDSEPARDGIAILDVEGFPLQQAWNVVHLDKKLLSVPARPSRRSAQAASGRLTAVRFAPSWRQAHRLGALRLR